MDREEIDGPAHVRLELEDPDNCGTWRKGAQQLPLFEKGRVRTCVLVFPTKILKFPLYMSTGAPRRDRLCDLVQNAAPRRPAHECGGRQQSSDASRPRSSPQRHESSPNRAGRRTRAMRYQIECYDGLYGDRWVVVDTARGEVLLPYNYSPAEAEHLCGMLNATCRAVPRTLREQTQPALHVVASHGLTVIQGGRTA